MSLIRHSAVSARSRARTAAVALLAATLSGGALLAAVPASAATTYTVDDDSACPGAAYTSISAAVAAASDGDTIKVCAGTYAEKVSTTKTLTFKGAQAGTDARTGRTSTAAESVVGIAAGAFSFDGAAGPEIIDGFTLTGASTDADTPGVLLNGGNSHIVTNTIFDGTHRGVFFSGDHVTVSRNRFLDNTQDSVFIGSGDGDDASIVDNRFVNTESALVTVPGGGDSITDGLVFSRNTQAGGTNGPVLFDTDGATVADNTIADTTSTSILPLGGNTDTTITGNVVTGSGGSGIALSTTDDRTNTGATIRGNVLRGNVRGINLAAATGTVKVTFNEIVGNTRAADGQTNAGLRNNSDATVDATHNWWGCNTGPGTAGCDAVDGSGTADVDPWLVLSGSIDHSSLDKGESTALRGDLRTDSDGNSAVDPAYPDGGLVSFSGGSLATAAPATDPLQDQAASTQLTAGQTAGMSTATVTYDSATVGVPYTVGADRTASISSVTKPEGAAGTKTPFVFTITLSRPSNAATTFTYATADGAAKAPSDYTATSGTLTIPAGATTGKITVTVLGDRTNEPTETFMVTLTSSGATTTAVSGGPGVGTITNDDPLPVIRVRDTSVAEGDSGITLMRFTVLLDRPSSQAVTTRFNTAAGSAGPGSDYRVKSGQITFSPGQTSTVVTVEIRGDLIKEPNETLFLSIFGASHARIDNANGVGVIRNDD